MKKIGSELEVPERVDIPNRTKKKSKQFGNVPEIKSCSRQEKQQLESELDLYTFNDGSSNFESGVQDFGSKIPEQSSNYSIYSDFEDINAFLEINSSYKKEKGSHPLLPINMKKKETFSTNKHLHLVKSFFQTLKKELIAVKKSLIEVKYQLIEEKKRNRLLFSYIIEKIFSLVETEVTFKQHQLQVCQSKLEESWKQIEEKNIQNSLLNERIYHLRERVRKFDLQVEHRFNQFLDEYQTQFVPKADQIKYKIQALSKQLQKSITLNNEKSKERNTMERWKNTGLSQLQFSQLRNEQRRKSEGLKDMQEKSHFQEHSTFQRAQQNNFQFLDERLKEMKKSILNRMKHKNNQSS